MVVSNACPSDNLNVEADADGQGPDLEESETAPLVAKTIGYSRDLISNKKDIGLRASSLQAGSLERALSTIPFFGNLAHHFGYKLLVMLFASQHLMKGFTHALIGPTTSFIFKSYKVPGPRMQIFGGVVGLPWAMKPVIGLISDAFPIFGFNKAPYVLITSVFGAVACASIGLLPQSHLPIERVVLFLFLMQFQFSTCDLLTEAKYAEKMQSIPEHGPALLSYVWFGLQVGGLMATMLIGPIMEHIGIKAPFVVALLPLVFILIPVSNNFMEEVARTPEQVAEARKKLLQQGEVCLLCLLMFAGTITLSILGMKYESPKVNAIAAVTVALVMLVAFSVTLKPVIAKVNAFFLLQTSLGISIGGASFYFYTDGPKEYPEGPHFSMEFYTSVLGTVGAVCSLIGIYSYQRWMSAWTYRKLLLMTNVVVSILSITDIIFFTRFNLKMGIPDHAFVLGSSVLTTVVGQWMWMPGVVILSQLCPKGMEATMYALLAGCHNLGNTIASSVGALVIQHLGCTPSGDPNESAKFDNLWVGSALSTVLPMITLLLLPVLIPDAKQTDKLLEENERDATAGSLWKRWTQ